MRPIDKFILHVVHNWKNELNEAYSEKIIKEIIQEEMDTAILKPGDEVSITVDDRRFGVYGSIS